MWLIPPQQKSTMHDFADPAVATVAACVCKYCGNVNPAAPHPIRNAVRRRICCSDDNAARWTSDAGILDHPLNSVATRYNISKYRHIGQRNQGLVRTRVATDSPLKNVQRNDGRLQRRIVSHFIAVIAYPQGETHIKFRKVQEESRLWPYLIEQAAKGTP
jgi:hypothetical protein